MDRCGRDASDDLVNSALDTLSAGKAGVEDSHLLAVLGNMKAMGRSFQEFDEWAAAAGCMCDRRPRWDNPPTGHQSDKPGWSIVNLNQSQGGMCIYRVLGIGAGVSRECFGP